MCPSSKVQWTLRRVRRPFNQRLTIPASAGTPRPATTKVGNSEREIGFSFFFSLSLFLFFPLAETSLLGTCSVGRES